ncbi:AAA family ATPase, partial [Streptomyces sp. UNOC14_S4]|uniref:AAA family ATPase n=1 Tax=Streptomyces sp. UNOC14_S4 TaxID=2872340 RepID=UPI001E30C747
APAFTAAEAPHGAPVSERRTVSVLLLRTVVDTDSTGLDTLDADAALEDAAVTVRREVEAFGGTLTASIGSVSLAVFDIAQADGNCAERAVRAALAVRDHFHGPAAPDDTYGPAVMAAVSTGEALVRVRPGATGTVPSVAGTLLDSCQSLLAQVPAGTVRVCTETRRATLSAIAYRGPDDVPAGRHASGALLEFEGHHRAPVVDREYELEVLGGLLERARYRAVPHLVTVLGEAGSGKSRLLMEFERRASELPEPVRFLSTATLPATEDGPLAVHARILAACCGILPDDTAPDAAARLAGAIDDLVGPGERADWLRSWLEPLAGPDPADRDAHPETVRAWRRLMVEIAREQPLVVAVDGLHRAADRVFEDIEDLADSSGSVPLLVIATARPELLERRPTWGGGRRHATTITLGPVQGTPMGRVLSLPVPTMRCGHPEPVRVGRSATAGLISLPRAAGGLGTLPAMSTYALDHFKVGGRCS